MKSNRPYSDAAAARSVIHVTTKMVAAYEQGRSACRARISPRSVHRLRAAIRRLLAGLRLLKETGARPPAKTQVLHRQLRVLGKLHDIQVQLHLVDEFGRASSLTPLRRHLEKKRKAYAESTQAALKRGGGIGAGSPKVPRHPGPVVRRLRRLLSAKLRRAFDPLAAYGPSTPVESASRHGVRKRAREFRYLAELTPKALFRGPPQRFLKSLEGFHSASGCIHDGELLCREIDRAVARGRMAALAAGEVRERLNQWVEPEKARCWQAGREVFHEAMVTRRFFHLSPDRKATPAPRRRQSARRPPTMT